MDWVQWVFSGIGVAVLTTIGGLLFKKHSNSKSQQIIKSGKDSYNIQGGRNVNVSFGEKRDEK